MGVSTLMDALKVRRTPLPSSSADNDPSHLLRPTPGLTFSVTTLVKPKHLFYDNLPASCQLTLFISLSPLFFASFPNSSLGIPVDNVSDYRNYKVIYDQDLL